MRSTLLAMHPVLATDMPCGRKGPFVLNDAGLGLLVPDGWLLDPMGLLPLRLSEIDVGDCRGVLRLPTRGEFPLLGLTLAPGLVPVLCSLPPGGWQLDAPLNGKINRFYEQAAIYCPEASDELDRLREFAFVRIALRAPLPLVTFQSSPQGLSLT